MPSESSASRFLQVVVRGRSLIYLAVADAVLFLIANVAYGGGDQHGLRNAVSNVTWVLFLLGVVLLILFGLIALGQLILRRGKAHGAGGVTS